MDPRSYRLYAASALDQTAARLAAALEDWRGAWGGERPTLAVKAASERANLARDAMWQWRAARRPDGTLVWIATQDGFGRAFAAGLFGAQAGWSASEPDLSIAGALGGEALAALSDAVWQGLGLGAVEPEPLSADARPDAALFRHGFGGLLVELGWQAGRVLLLCDGERAVPRGPARPRPALAPLAGALRAVPAKLEVDLGEVTLSLGELQTLGVGDVLCLRAPLERPLEVKVEGRALARAQLGASDGHRAVALIKK